MIPQAHGAISVGYAAAIKYAVDCDNHSFRLIAPPGTTTVEIDADLRDLQKTDQVPLLLGAPTHQRMCLGSGLYSYQEFYDYFPCLPQRSLEELRLGLRAGHLRAWIVDPRSGTDFALAPEFWERDTLPTLLWYGDYARIKVGRREVSAKPQIFFSSLCDFLSSEGRKPILFRSPRAGRDALNLDLVTLGATGLSPYLQFMLRAAHALKLVPGKRKPKSEVEIWLKGNWPGELGSMSDEKISYMATFLRYPLHEKGGFIK